MLKKKCKSTFYVRKIRYFLSVTPLFTPITCAMRGMMLYSSPIILLFERVKTTKKKRLHLNQILDLFGFYTIPFNYNNKMLIFYVLMFICCDLYFYVRMWVFMICSSNRLAIFNFGKDISSGFETSFHRLHLKDYKSCLHMPQPWNYLRSTE